MNIKKITLCSFAIVGLSFSLFSMNTNAQAATWHKGAPSFLKHSFYRTKLGPKYFNYGGKKVKNSNLRRYEGIRTYKSTIHFEGAQYNMNLSNCRYTKKGNHYLVRGKFSKSAKSYPAIKIKKNSKKVLYVSAGSMYKGHTKPSFSKSERMTKIK